MDIIREHFGAEPDIQYRVEGNRIVVYCRRSEKDSKSKSQSTKVQFKAIEAWAQENGHQIVKKYLIDGETSKRGSKRPSIEKLMEYCKNPKNKVSDVVVFHTERFGRDGKYLTHILDDLIDLGIGFIDLDDPQDVFTPQGRLTQIIKFFKAEIDNEKRKKYVNANVEDQLLNGYKQGGVPRGYTSERVDQDRVITVNDEGRLLRKAFEMKLNEGISNKEIAIRMKALGLDVTDNWLGKAFSNPFYCGLIKDVRNPAPRGISVGHHDPIISQEEFCRINQKSNPNRTKKKSSDRVETSLKRHLVCPLCENNMTGYFVEKKQLGYYKCRKCPVNHGAKDINNQYAALLEKIAIKEECIPMLKEKLAVYFDYLERVHNVKRDRLQDRFREVAKKREKVFDKLVDEPDAGIVAGYRKLIKDLNHSIEDINKSITELDYESIDVDKKVDSALTFGTKIAELWKNGDIDMKLGLQKLVFPKHVYYDKKSNSLIPIEINPILEIMGFLGGNDSGNNNFPNPSDLLNDNPKSLTDKVNDVNSVISTVSDGSNDEVLDPNNTEKVRVVPFIIRSNNNNTIEIGVNRFIELLDEIRYFNLIFK